MIGDHRRSLRSSDDQIRLRDCLAIECAEIERRRPGSAPDIVARLMGQWLSEIERLSVALRTSRDCRALELTYDEARELHGSAAMMIDCTGIRPAYKTRPWLVSVFAAVFALGAAGSSSAQTNAHDLLGVCPGDCADRIAMSVWNQIWAPPMPANLQKGSDSIARALALDAKTSRERDYLEALAAFYTGHDTLDHRTRAEAYMRKMEQIAQRYRDEHEARIFYALSLLATADGLDKTYKNQLKAGEILEQVFAEKPQHPGPSHYIIHAYDYPALVDRALAAAQNYAICVTVVPHAIHMPSHTYVLLGRWKDTITANNAATQQALKNLSNSSQISNTTSLLQAQQASVSALSTWNDTPSTARTKTFLPPSRPERS